MKIIPRQETRLTADIAATDTVIPVESADGIWKYDLAFVGDDEPEFIWVTNAEGTCVEAVRGTAHPELGTHRAAPHKAGERVCSYEIEYTPEEWEYVWPYMVSPEDPLARAIIRERESSA